jgi:hypothetical protein
MTDLRTRILAKVDEAECGYETPCWLWQGEITDQGYGRFLVGGKRMRVHRAAYEVWRGPIPAQLVIDHLCRTRACVNPGHLEPVTHRENTLRGDNPRILATHQTKKTQCPQGHPLFGTNLYVRPSDGGRICRQCNRASCRRNATKGRGASLSPDGAL